MFPLGTAVLRPGAPCTGSIRWRTPKSPSCSRMAIIILGSSPIRVTSSAASASRRRAQGEPLSIWMHGGRRRRIAAGAGGANGNNGWSGTLENARNQVRWGQACGGTRRCATLLEVTSFGLEPRTWAPAMFPSSRRDSHELAQADLRQPCAHLVGRRSVERASPPTMAILWRSHSRLSANSAVNSRIDSPRPRPLSR
jgi:hypothetical protein